MRSNPQASGAKKPFAPNIFCLSISYYMLMNSSVLPQTHRKTARKIEKETKSFPQRGMERI